MEKQLTFFEPEENDSLSVWQSLPEENRQRIEGVFVQILIRHLSTSVEVKNCEK